MTKGKLLSRAGLVMIVEDDPLLSQDMADAIKDAGAKKVATFSSVADALTAFEKHQPAVLVLDVNLADRGDGWALAELAIQLSPKRPAIVFSTGSPESIPPQIVDMGTLLSKPFPMAVLVKAIADQLPNPGFMSRILRPK